jgi:hypothetical protein
VFVPHSGRRFVDTTIHRSTAREPLNHLSCIAFLSASDKSVEAVKAELARPRYGGYWLCEFGFQTLDRVLYAGSSVKDQNQMGKARRRGSAF